MFIRTDFCSNCVDTGYRFKYELLTKPVVVLYFIFYIFLQDEQLAWNALMSFSRECFGCPVPG